jgi:DNA (cytosine-5)-methyltransferase 1
VTDPPAQRDRAACGMNVLSLFAGIGGLELGLERAGMTVVGQVEIDPFCRRVLAKHWPEVPKHDDVRTCPEWWASEPRPGVDVVAGGFPCQPFSSAGVRRGVSDERWGWPWMESVVRLVRPCYVVVENVAELLADRDAFGRVLADLAELGFDAEWGVLSACAVGAPHMRRRVFVVAHPAVRPLPRQVPPHPRPGKTCRDEPGGGHRSPRRQWWLREPALDRVAHGAPRSVVRAPLHALGNAVVPQVAEHIGRLIVAAEQGVAA